MYNAYGDPSNINRQGSTRLHLDVTGAINIMLHAADLADGSHGGAVWHIFPPASQSILRDFLTSEPSIGFQDPGDPIHNQTIYLTPPMLQLLADKHGVHPYTFHQKLGDAIFIPAGCPHQVMICSAPYTEN